MLEINPIDTIINLAPSELVILSPELYLGRLLFQCQLIRGFDLGTLHSCEVDFYGVCPPSYIFPLIFNLVFLASANYIPEDFFYSNLSNYRFNFLASAR